MATKNPFAAVSGLDAGSLPVPNVADPVNAQDAATKNFATNASNLASGTLPAARLPAYTGDATTSAGSSEIANGSILASNGGAASSRLN